MSFSVYLGGQRTSILSPDTKIFLPMFNSGSHGVVHTKLRAFLDVSKNPCCQLPFCQLFGFSWWFMGYYSATLWKRLKLWTISLGSAAKYEAALEKFETVLGLKPAAREEAVASYNVACCYSQLKQVNFLSFASSNFNSITRVWVWQRCFLSMDFEINYLNLFDLCGHLESMTWWDQLAVIMLIISIRTEHNDLDM